MVLIEVANDKNIEIKPRKNLFEEFAETKEAVEKLKIENKEIKSFSFKRIVKTESSEMQSLIKDASLPEDLNFWAEPLNRKLTEHMVWFKSSSLDKIYMSYSVLLERLSEVRQ